MSGLFDGAENARLSNVERECKRYEIEHMPEMIKAFKAKAAKEAAEKEAGSQAPAETPTPAEAKPTAAAPGAKA
jgi:hypothetical protein